MSKITSVLFCDLFHKLGLRLHLGGRAVEFLTIRQEYILCKILGWWGEGMSVVEKNKMKM